MQGQETYCERLKCLPGLISDIFSFWFTIEVTTPVNGYYMIAMCETTCLCGLCAHTLLSVILSQNNTVVVVGCHCCTHNNTTTKKVVV